MVNYYYGRGMARRGPGGPVDLSLQDVSAGPEQQPRRGRPEVGMCASCLHRREVRNTRGSSFSLCLRSRDDPSYPRYPRLPVLSCRGYERRSDGGGLG